VILDHFKARPNHIFVEFDYKQLEIRVLALASRDKQLIDDINKGVDMHTYFASQIFNKAEDEVTPKERKMSKGFSFQLQYGSSANGIARFWDVSKPFAEAFISKYYQRYPQVLLWQQSVLSEASDTLEYTGDIQDGWSVPRGYIPSIWKDQADKPIIQFTALGQNSDTWDGVNRFYVSRTKTKNYPIQGAASDILMMMLNILYKYIYNTPINILNTVHDSVLIEIPEALDVDSTIKDITLILESVPEILWNLFKVDSPIDFPVEWSTGKTLSEVKQNV
jgi:DNA polymerase-1